jgi:hypothetical protein
MVAEIRAGQKPLTPLWNWVAADPGGSHKPNRSHRKEGISLSINGFWPTAFRHLARLSPPDEGLPISQPFAATPEVNR